LDKDQRELAAGAGTGSRQRAASRVRNFCLALTVGSVGKASTYIFFREIREFPQNVGMTHSASQVFQNVIHRDPQAANAWFATPLARFDGDDIGVAHSATLLQKPGYSNEIIKCASDLKMAMNTRSKRSDNFCCHTRTHLPNRSQGVVEVAAPIAVAEVAGVFGWG